MTVLSLPETVCTMMGWGGVGRGAGKVRSRVRVQATHIESRHFDGGMRDAERQATTRGEGRFETSGIAVCSKHLPARRGMAGLCCAAGMTSTLRHGELTCVSDRSSLRLL